MSKKKKRNRNPVLQKKYDEGFEDGVAHATNYFMTRFLEFEDVPGIGEKTFEKIKKQFGVKYFK